MNLEIESLVIQYIYNIIEVAFLILIGFLIHRLITLKSDKETKIVRKQAFTDQLTGRGNRYMFLSVLDNLIKKKKKFAVCFMDLDGFKQINDTMGHDAGDELLISLANTFENKLPKNATAYRLGGDEFAIVIQNIKTIADVTKLLDNLQMELKTPFVIQNTSISLEYSLGVAIYPEDADNRQDLVMYADDAMYYIKEHGKNGYYFHNKSLKAKLENDNKMRKDLKEAFEKEQFGFSMQPRININDTSKLCFEALLYWDHPVLGKINSEYFIKQADEMALTIKLDQYVLRQVCARINELKEKGLKIVKMAINISHRHAAKKDFIDKLCDILNEYGIQKGDIQFELIGTVDLKNIENYKTMFERLKACGAEIVVNNFEVKHEYLALFKDLSIDEIKLTAMYVDESTNLPRNTLDNIVKLSNDLGYKVIIGCIENENELIEAINSGADMIQGNFIFKAMENDFVDEFISEYGNYKNRIENIILNAKLTSKKSSSKRAKKSK